MNTESLRNEVLVPAVAKRWTLLQKQNLQKKKLSQRRKSPLL